MLGVILRSVARLYAYVENLNKIFKVLFLS